MIVVDIECSPVAGCKNIAFQNYDVAIPANQSARLICQNVDGISGLNGSYITFRVRQFRGLTSSSSTAPCNATGRP